MKAIQNELAHKNLIGMRFGKYVVIGRGRSGNAGRYWICRCDCGTINEVRGYELTHGIVKQCRACSIRESRKKRNRKADSICWECQRAINKPSKMCSWAICAKPVDGWNAKPCTINNAGRIISSFKVLGCPLFVDDLEAKI